MPIHDWSRVDAGTFHDFHVGWIASMRTALNNGVLPPDYYAMAEQIAGPYGPDVLTLQAEPRNGVDHTGRHEGTIALATAAPRVRSTAEMEMSAYSKKQSTLTIRHSSDDQVVALIEIVSKGNKSSRVAMKAFVEKAIGALIRECHLLILDLQRPGPRDPQGIHGAIWDEFENEPYVAPLDKPLTLVAYAANLKTRAFIEPVAVGDTLPEMPLFLEPEAYVNVPLEATYQEAYRGVPFRWKRVLEAPGI